jgi:predicted acetyltransferase
VTPYPLRDATADDFDRICRLFCTAFGVELEDDALAVKRLVFEPERGHVITHGAEIVANTASFARELGVPGGAVPAAHVTMVAVEPTHHRRGLLRRLMTHQLQTVGESVAVLWATEGRIYQRFGYGMAAKSASLEIKVREIEILAPAVGEVRAGVPAEVRKELVEAYERARAFQPGLSSRPASWWDVIVADPPSRRNGYTARRALLFERDGTVEGYALWRAKQGWSHTGPDSETRVIELVAATPEAHAALWRFLVSVDLARTVVAGPIGADDPVMHLVNEPNALGARVGDGLWVRLVDLPRALAARRYAAPLDVVFEVTDDLLPANAGRWRLRVAADGTAECSPTSDSPDLTGGIAELGAAYLAGTSLGQLALIGRVRELRPGALAAASTAFSWPIRPTAIEIF